MWLYALSRLTEAREREKVRVRGACFGDEEASPIDMLNDSDTLRSNYCAVIRATRSETYGSFLLTRVINLILIQFDKAKRTGDYAYA